MEWSVNMLNLLADDEAVANRIHSDCCLLISRSFCVSSNFLVHPCICLPLLVLLAETSNLNRYTGLVYWVRLHGLNQGRL